VDIWRGGHTRRDRFPERSFRDLEHLLSTSMECYRQGIMRAYSGVPDFDAYFRLAARMAAETSVEPRAVECFRLRSAPSIPQHSHT
jgi:hypothetical protein